MLKEHNFQIISEQLEIVYPITKTMHWTIGVHEPSYGFKYNKIKILEESRL